jgi:small subunit ribosomal protein S17
MSAETSETTRPRGSRRTLIGTVTSDKMQKTVVVTVTRRVKASLYAKYVTRKVKYKAHNESNDVKTGDVVEIVESRPLSKDKRWRVSRLLEKAKSV